MRLVCLVFCGLFTATASWANDLALHKVSDHVYALVGSLDNRSADNRGNNATFGFIVTQEGVIVVDPGGSYQGAQHIHKLIQQVTDLPISWVINTGGQDHRWLGNGYFRAQGAQVIASRAAVADQKLRVRDQLIALSTMVGTDGMRGTEPVYADVMFESRHSLALGGVDLEIHHVGPAHTPGDSFVWLPQQQVMFTGDIVYTQRMLSVGEQSNSRGWVTAFNAMAKFQPKFVVPGHGAPTDLLQAEAETLEYLQLLRREVRQLIDEGGDISEIAKIEQTQFADLHNYDLLAGRNAQQVFAEMEWE